jgi:arylsulfatase A-like enzyme
VLAAAGIGSLAGLVEGLQLDLARSAPAILAPYKVSADILWVAPLVNGIGFALAGLVLAPLARRLVPRLADRILASGLAGVAAAINLYTLKLIHPLSALLLALAIGVAVSRLSERRMQRLLGGAARLAIVTPLLIVVLLGGVRVSGILREKRAMAALPVGSANAPSVLILLLDTVRRDRFDARPDRSPTPRLDEFARRATWFANAWSTTSWSLPSQASLLTGVHPHQHGADWPALELRPGLRTMPERFGEAGYVTGAFSGNAAWIVPEHVGRGFHRFRVYRLEDLLRRTLIGRALDRPLILLGAHSSGRGRAAATLNADLLEFLDARGGRPFFAYLCYMDVNRLFHRRQLGHPAWTPEPEPRSVVAAYDSGLTALDAEVGSLLDRLRVRGDLDNTIVVILSDHGESFPGGAVGDHPPAGHGTSLFPEQVRVPLWISRPGSSAADTVQADVSIRDVPTTVAALASLATDGLGGSSLISRAAGDSDVLATLRYAGREANALVSERFLLIEQLERGARRPRVFFMAEDSLAQIDRAGDSVRTAALLARLRAALGG